MNPPLTLSPLGGFGVACDDVVALVVEASFDPVIQAMNDLPPCLDEAQARAYCEQREGVVLRLDGRPVGVVVAHRAPDPGEGVAIPPGCVELDEWLLPPWRGQGILGKRGWPLLRGWLAERYERVLDVTWADNHPAIALMRSRGYRSLGRSYWSGRGRAGPCEVFLYELAPHRAPGGAQLGDRNSASTPV